MESWAEPLHQGDGRASSEAEQAGLPFSLALFPVATHPLVTRLGPSVTYRLLAQRLYAYMDWTIVLETDAILPVVKAIVEDGYDLGGGLELQRDALKIVYDEGKHAWEAMSTKHEVIAMTGIFAEPSATPGYLHCLRRAREEAQPGDQTMIDLLFAIVSETLITKMLTQLPRDETVLPLVRSTVLDHARDEARHHLVFAQIIQIAWARWAPDQRARYAPLLAEFVAAFLQPDLGSIRRWLVASSLPEVEARAVIEDVYSPSAVHQDMRDASLSGLYALRQAGLYDCQAFVDALGIRGLV
jgi:hypothetical protein